LFWLAQIGVLVAGFQVKVQLEIPLKVTKTMVRARLSHCLNDYSFHAHKIRVLYFFGLISCDHLPARRAKLQ